MKNAFPAAIFEDDVIIPTSFDLNKEVGNVKAF